MRPSHIILSALALGANAALNHQDVPVKVNTGVVNADVAVATRQTGDEKRALLHFEAPVKVNTGVVDADVNVAIRQTDDEKRALNHFEAPVKVNTGVVNADVVVATRRTTDDEVLGAVVSACKNGKDDACKELEKLGRPAKRALNHFEAPAKVNTGVVNVDVKVATRQMNDEKRALNHFEAPVKVNTGVVSVDAGVTIS